MTSHSQNETRVHRIEGVDYITLEDARLMKERAVEEYKQFVLNVLDGVDTADGYCTTKAIRFALQNRIITTTKTDHLPDQSLNQERE